jgi:platelet-activating factor acetylhydrolase IB subunit alpha
VHPVFTLAASGSEDGTIKVRVAMRIHSVCYCSLFCPRAAYSLSFSPQQIWDHESGEFMKTLKGHTNTVNGLDFTPRGTHLASCSTDLSIKLWDLTSRNGQQQQQYACVRTLRGHDHTISAVRFLPLFAGNSMLSEQRGSENHQQQQQSASSASSGPAGGGVLASAAGCQYLVSASRDATVKMWDVETGFCDHTVSDHSDWVRCLAVQMHARSRDGGGSSSSTASASSSVVWASSGNDTVIYVYEGRKPVLELRGHEHVVESLAFLTEEPFRPAPASSREGKHVETVRDYLASGSRDRTVRLWKLSEAACLATFVAHENWVRSVLIHPSGNYVISASDDKTIRVFDVAGKRCLRVLEKAHDHFVTSIAMHPTLPVLVSGGVDQTVRCWQLD